MRFRWPRSRRTSSVSSAWPPRRWAVWSVPLVARGYLLLAHTTVLSATAWVFLHATTETEASVRFAILTALAVGYAVAVDRVALLR